MLTQVPFRKTGSLVATTAGTAITILPAVGAGKKVYITEALFIVNGATAWTLVTNCFIEDTAAVQLVSATRAQLIANAKLMMNVLTLSNNINLQTGATDGSGLRIKCNINGTGSNLQIVVTGFIE